MRQSNYDWVCKHMKASGTGIEPCAPLDHHGKSLHLFLTLLRLLSCWTVAVPGPYLPLMPAVVAPGRFNVKLMFLMTPSRVFSSYLSKQPVMCSIFPSVPPSLFSKPLQHSIQAPHSLALRRGPFIGVIMLFSSLNSWRRWTVRAWVWCLNTFMIFDKLQRILFPYQSPLWFIPGKSCTVFAYWNLALLWVVCRGMWHLEFLEDPLADILEYQIYLFSCTFFVHVCRITHFFQTQHWNQDVDHCTVAFPKQNEEGRGALRNGYLLAKWKASKI